MSIKKKLAGSALWISLGAGFQQLSGFVIFVILARLLSPQQFGIVAFAAIFIDIGRIFVASGVSDALVRRTDWNDDFASTAFWINLGVSILVVFVCVFAIGPAVGAAGHQDLGLVLSILACTLLVDALSLALTAKLRRDFAYKKIATRNVASNVVGGVAGIALAFLGFGVWALVFQRVATSVLTCLVTWSMVGWRPRFVFSKAHARELVQFSAGLIGSQLLATANSQAIPLILGFALGPVPLAIYRAGNRGLRLVTQLTIAPLQQAALPAFSQVPPTSLATNYCRVTRATSLLSCPIFVGAAAVAPDFVAICFGDRWTASGPVMAMLGLMVGASTLGYFLSPVLIAVGQARRLFLFYAIAVAGNVLFTTATLPFGLMIIAAAQTVRAYLAVPVTLGVLHRAIGLRPVDAVKGIALPLLSAFLMGAVVFGLRVFVLDGFHATARLAIVVPIGVFVYFGILRIFARRFLQENLNELMPLLPPFVRRNLP
jgi:O-antigen/teichoic acid export membrane protein